jgi:hypothetical protein
MRSESGYLVLIHKILPLTRASSLKKVLFFILIFSIQHAIGQQKQVIKGIIADSATYKLLPYVNIQIKNTSRGTYSDEKGNFSVTASFQDTLLISLVGYKTTVHPLEFWEPGIILLAESPNVLRSVTIEADRMEDLYKDLFNEENDRLAKNNKALPFYYSKMKKEKIRIKRSGAENIRVRTYVDLVINDPEIKSSLMKKYGLKEEAYYTLLTKFNEENHSFMYYLTAAELLSHLNRFFEKFAPVQKAK